MHNVSYSISELASRFGFATLDNSADVQITGVATLAIGGAGKLGFLANRKYATDLSNTSLSAVLVAEADANAVPEGCVALISRNPYADYARIAQLFAPKAQNTGIHENAVIDSSAAIASGTSIGAGTVVEAGATIAENCNIGPNCYIGAGSAIGAEALIYANVSIYHGVKIGKRVVLHSNATIGADGFGFAPDTDGFVKVPQLGGVHIGDDVEVGACTTVDRGALEDTIIENGVKLDNQVQIGHGAVIGEHSVLAGRSAVAGSTKVGKRCMFGGGVGLAGHITIADGVILTGGTVVYNSINEAGMYSSGMGHDKSANWRRNSVRLKQLNDMYKRITALEKQQAKN